MVIHDKSQNFICKFLEIANTFYLINTIYKVLPYLYLRSSDLCFDFSKMLINGDDIDGFWWIVLYENMKI